MEFQLICKMSIVFTVNGRLVSESPIWSLRLGSPCLRLGTRPSLSRRRRIPGWQFSSLHWRRILGIGRSVVWDVFSIAHRASLCTEIALKVFTIVIVKDHYMVNIFLAGNCITDPKDAVVHVSYNLKFGEFLLLLYIYDLAEGHNSEANWDLIANNLAHAKQA